MHGKHGLERLSMTVYARKASCTERNSPAKGEGSRRGCPRPEVEGHSWGRPATAASGWGVEAAGGVAVGAGWGEAAGVCVGPAAGAGVPCLIACGGASA